jgi:hypothetical protein
MLTNEEASTIASGWHSVMTWSDPGVAMYSVTSTGKVHSEKHRKDLLAYIDGCMADAAENDKHGDEPVLSEFDSQVQELQALRTWVEDYPIVEDDENC